ncbi:hypothetical protein D9M72_459820 [compost metagenome]
MAASACRAATAAAEAWYRSGRTHHGPVITFATPDETTARASARRCGHHGRSLPCRADRLCRTGARSWQALRCQERATEQHGCVCPGSGPGPDRRHASGSFGSCRHYSGLYQQNDVPERDHFPGRRPECPVQRRARPCVLPQRQRNRCLSSGHHQVCQMQQPAQRHRHLVHPGPQSAAASEHRPVNRQFFCHGDHCLGPNSLCDSDLRVQGQSGIPVQDRPMAEFEIRCQQPQPVWPRKLRLGQPRGGQRQIPNGAVAGCRAMQSHRHREGWHARQRQLRSRLLEQPLRDRAAVGQAAGRA